jgi:hypothetical protein
MTDSEINDFLTVCPNPAHCATVNRDGSPHVVPVWYDFRDNGTIVMTMRGGTQKAKNLKRDPRVALSIETLKPEMAFVQIRGSVAINENPTHAEVLAHTTKCAARFVDATRAEELGRLYASAPEEWIVTITPTRRIGMTQLDRM